MALSSADTGLLGNRAMGMESKIVVLLTITTDVNGTTSPAMLEPLVPYVRKGDDGEEDQLLNQDQFVSEIFTPNNRIVDRKERSGSGHFSLYSLVIFRRSHQR